MGHFASSKSKASDTYFQTAIHSNSWCSEIREYKFAVRNSKYLILYQTNQRNSSNKTCHLLAQNKHAKHTLIPNAQTQGLEWPHYGNYKSYSRPTAACRFGLVAACLLHLWTLKVFHICLYHLKKKNQCQCICWIFEKWSFVFVTFKLLLIVSPQL